MGSLLDIEFNSEDLVIIDFWLNYKLHPLSLVKIQFSPLSLVKIQFSPLSFDRFNLVL